VLASRRIEGGSLLVTLETVRTCIRLIRLS
jgi:hypothetical protein